MAPTARHIDPARLERSLRHLQDEHDAVSLEQALEHVLDAAVVLFRATGAGLMSIDEERALRYVAATDEAGRLLEETQERIGEGPCVDALVYDTVVQSRDLAADDRWPGLRPAVSDRGVRAVLGAPVRVAGETVGSLDAYVAEPYEWDASDVEALQAYSRLIGSLLATALRAQERSKLAQQLQHALDNRVLIERAVGMIMARHGTDAVAAYNLLRRGARNRRERVAERARRVLAGEPVD